MGVSGPALDLRLRVSAGAAGQARRRTEASFSSLDQDTLGDLMLLVSELVTNSYLHAGLTEDDHLQVTLRLRPDGLVAGMVCDGGSGFSAHGSPGGPPGGPGRGGMGLVILGEVAERWGVDQGRRTCVWFELAKAA